MIRLQRRSPPPALVRLLNRVKADIRAFYALDERERYQRRFVDSVTRLLMERTVREQLLRLTHRKCAYCETALVNQPGEIGCQRSRRDRQPRPLRLAHG